MATLPMDASLGSDKQYGRQLGPLASRSHPHSHRSHLPSLSIARSPSILASGSFAPLPDLDECLSESQRSRPKSILASAQELSSISQDDEDMEQDTASVPTLFQPPDSKEKIAITLSLVAITAISVAACLTTLLDWVL